MADASVRLIGPVQPGLTAADAYMVPNAASAILRNIHVANTTGAPVTFTLAIGTSGIDTAASRMFDQVAVPGFSAFDWTGNIVVNQNEYVTLKASAASALTVTVSGVTTDAPAAAPVAFQTTKRSIIATEETITSTTYVEATTPDRVTGVVVPEAGIVRLGFAGMWKESVDGAARAAIFIGTNQLKVARNGTAAPIVQEAANQGTANVYTQLVAGTHGLIGNTGEADAHSVAYTGDVTTGQVLGTLGVWADVGNPMDVNVNSGTILPGMGFGEASIYLPAGTYDFSIRYKSTSGTVTVKERKLWVQTEAANAPPTVGSVNPPAYVSSLPLAPTDGQEVYYNADAANGVIWHLRYRAAATGPYKWEYIGGPPLVGDQAASVGTTTSTTYVTAMSLLSLPSVTVPLAGDYDVTVFSGGAFAQTTATAYLSYAVGGTAASNTDAAYQYNNGLSGTSARRRKTGIAAATVIQMQAKTGAGTFHPNNGEALNLGLRVRPVRVG